MAMGLNLGVSWEHGIGVGTRGAPGARAPQVFSLFHIYPVLQMKFYILCPPNQKVFPTPLCIAHMMWRFCCC